MHIESDEGKKWLKEITELEYFEKIVRLDVLLFRYAELILENVERGYVHSKRQPHVSGCLVMFMILYRNIQLYGSDRHRYR